MRWEQMGAYGTGLLFIDYDKEETLRYKCINLKNVTLGQNHQGIVNRVDRVLHMSLLDIVSKFGKGGLPDTLLIGLDDVASANKKLTVLHSVMPAEKKKGFSSYYILVKDRLLLSEGKYKSFPYSVSRYNTSPDEVFGRGLAMQCMSDVLNLNKYQNDINLALDGSIKPTVLTQDDSIADNGVIDMAPNSVIVVDSSLSISAATQSTLTPSLNGTILGFPLWSSPPTITLLGAMSMTPLSAILSSNND
jgi:hypothetical protein